MSEKTPITIINFRWACGCLAACLIGTLSVKWAESPQIVNIISVALSLASLILAVIAIIQALVSNDGMLRSLSDINNAASNILSVSKDLNVATSAFSGHVDRIGLMPNQLSEINNQVIEIKSKIDIERTSTSQSPPLTTEIPLRDVEYTPRRLTYGVTLSLYMIRLSAKNKKSFKCKDAIDPNIFEYCNGVIAGIRASEIADIEFDDSVFTIKDLGKLKPKEIDNLVFTAMKDEKAPSLFNDYVKQIDAYFKSASSTPPAS